MVLFLSDLCFLLLCRPLLVLFFGFYLMVVFLCFPLFCFVFVFVFLHLLFFGIAQVWSLLPNHDSHAMCSMISGNASLTPLILLSFQYI